MRKTLQDLTIKDNFMFAAVMADSENCKELLEMVLEIPIAKIHVHPEKTIIYNPTSKGVRLDIEAEDEEHTHYDVEMQVEKKETLRRARYYHDQMDMELLTSGQKYDELPNSYVIFICDYDPFDKRKYRYTMKQMCMEEPELDADAGIHTILLSTKGTNDDEVSEQLRKFLKYVGSNLENSEDNYEDTYIGRLQNAVRRIKQDRKLGERYMLFEELLDEMKAKGREEGIEKGRAEGIEKGRTEEIYQCVYEKDFSVERGAEKLGKTADEFLAGYIVWKEKKEKR